MVEDVVIVRSEGDLSHKSGMVVISTLSDDSVVEVVQHVVTIVNVLLAACLSSKIEEMRHLKEYTLNPEFARGILDSSFEFSDGF